MLHILFTLILIPSILSQVKYSVFYSIFRPGDGESNRDMLGTMNLAEYDQVEWTDINDRFDSLISNIDVSEKPFLRIHINDIITSMPLEAFLPQNGGVKSLCNLQLNLMLNGSNQLYHASLSVSNGISSCEMRPLSVKISRGQLVKGPRLTKPVSVAQDGQDSTKSLLGKYW